MRILYIGFHYPPDPAVGSVRAGRVVTALREAGHTVKVVTVRLDRNAPADADVRRVRRLPNAREAALWIRNRFRTLLRRSVTHPGADNSAGYSPPADVAGWKRFLVAMALMPDDQQGFIFPALLTALRISMSGVDLVYSSGPPHSAHIVALGVKRLRRVPWVAEFRDPWTDNAVQPRYARSDTAFAMKRWLERTCLASADRVVTVTEAVAELFRGKMPGGGAPVNAVLNGIEPISADEAVDPEPGTRILYLGNLYYRRDPRPFLEAISELRKAGSIAEGLLRIDFYGNCRWFHDVDVQQLADQLGLENVVTVHDPVTRSEALRLASRADLLLLFAQEQPLQVPQKLYDYLAAGKPILAFADADGETAAMLERLGGHYLANETVKPIVETVSEALSASGRMSRAVNRRLLDEWSAASQFARLVELVENTAGTPAE